MKNIKAEIFAVKFVLLFNIDGSSPGNLNRQSSTSSSSSLSRSSSSQKMEEGLAENGDGDSQSNFPSGGKVDKEESVHNVANRASFTQDAVRLKCREHIAAALKAGGLF